MHTQFYMYLTITKRFIWKRSHWTICF